MVSLGLGMQTTGRVVAFSAVRFGFSRRNTSTLRSSFSSTGSHISSWYRASVGPLK